MAFKRIVTANIILYVRKVTMTNMRSTLKLALSGADGVLHVQNELSLPDVPGDTTMVVGSWPSSCVLATSILFCSTMTVIPTIALTDDMLLCACTPYLKNPKPTSLPLQEQATCCVHPKSAMSPTWSDTHAMKPKVGDQLLAGHLPDDNMQLNHATQKVHPSLGVPGQGSRARLLTPAVLPKGQPYKVKRKE